MHSKLSRRKPLAGAVAALAVVTALASCGTGVSSDANSADKTTGGGVAAQRAGEQLEALYGSGTYQEPASDGPKGQKGYDVALVIAGVQTPTGTKVAEAAQEATKVLGWGLSIYDGQYNPSEYQEGIRQAIVQDVDAIWLYSIDCPLVQTALDEAKKASIPVFSHESADCSDVDPKSESYFERTLPFAEGDFSDWGQGLGEAQAIWLLAKRGDEANIIEVSVPELVVTKAVSVGFNAKMKELCPKCEVTTVEVQTADFGPPLQEKIATALLRNPDANGLALSYDDLATAGGSAAVMEAARNDSLLVVAGTNFAPTMDLIRDDKGLDAGFVYDENYAAWAAVDMINRYFAGAENSPIGGPGLAVVDADHGLAPEGKDWTTNIDFRTAYKNNWGVS
ncbi:sugar ABC transporter substrate-binding protein [Paenarthrobacter sp. TA1.8]|uniref:sugar ABC transporter substrate-binding protein n=1 Tax=Paenarthrobacter sp. TA1.8 TaxID=3400219 RepID=UPI003B42E6CF